MLLVRRSKSIPISKKYFEKCTNYVHFSRIADVSDTISCCYCCRAIENFHLGLSIPESNIIGNIKDNGDIASVAISVAYNYVLITHRLSPHSIDRNTGFLLTA